MRKQVNNWNVERIQENKIINLLLFCLIKKMKKKVNCNLKCQVSDIL